MAVPADTAAVATARHRIEDLLPRLDRPYESDVVILLTSEIVANAVVHGRSPIELLVWETPRSLRVEVSDDGDGIAPAPGTMPAEARAERGRGIAVVNGLADRWGTERSHGRTTVWFECDAPGPSR